MRVIVEPPELCPWRSTALVSELVEMGFLGIYPVTREFIIDDLEPFCMGLEEM